ncbi:hypothetical protein BX600DRAFT_469979 [Xylariales sp. PMI_506]|nr:hypothetical protein BX600DRAFT_469979 [Xylariales sp. PMI_506]
MDQLDEQEMYKEVLEADLDQHKEALAEMSRELAEKNCVIEAQEYLILSATEETQDLANLIAGKEHMISTLLGQIEQSDIGDIERANAKKRKIGSRS